MLIITKFILIVLLYFNFSGIGDPCEKDAIDATGNLTAQDRENITASAQDALRQISFRQLYKVLGMTKPLPLGSRMLNTTNKTPGGPSPGKKRPRENSQSDAISPESMYKHIFK